MGKESFSTRLLAASNKLALRRCSPLKLGRLREEPQVTCTLPNADTTETVNPN